MIGSIPLENARRCKHCREVVIGDHAERVAHRSTCQQRPRVQQPHKDEEEAEISPSAREKAEGKTSVGGAPAGHTPRRAKTNIEDKDDPQLASAEDATVQGAASGGNRTKMRILNAQNSSSRKTTRVENGASRLIKDRLMLTPDLTDFDTKLAQLAGRLLPPIEAKKTVWVNCQFCNKRITSDRMKRHVQSACVVGAIMSKVEWLEQLSGSTSTTAGETGAKVPQERQSLLAASRASPHGVVLSAQINGLPREAALTEELRLAASVINMVVPLPDHLLATVAADPKKLLLHAHEVRRCAQEWAAGLAASSSNSKKNKGDSPGVDSRSQAARQASCEAITESPLPLQRVLHCSMQRITSSRPSITEEKLSSGTIHRQRTRRESPTQKGAADCCQRFDRETLALATAIVNGDITFAEALNQSYKNIPAQSEKAKAAEEENDTQIQKWLRRQ
jgi:hypothetical protein